ncbi:TPA: serine--tRNA ligase, partial [archaeon]|nr:serine--tRNA ligase [Candidatus Naiadarchaeales archaeon SRR2090153.bin1042]
MIDVNLLRTNPEIAKDSQRRRGIEVSLVDKVLEADKKWRTLKGELDELRAERNKLGEEIGKLKKKGENPVDILNRVSILSGKIKKQEEELAELEQKRDKLLLEIPNILHETVPQGKDEGENVEIKKIRKPTKFPFQPKDHIDLGLNLDLFDVERAAKTSGARFYFLKNEAVLLELALVQYAMDFLVKKQGFTPIIVPDLVKERSMYGVGMLPPSPNEIYKIENE